MKRPPNPPAATCGTHLSDENAVSVRLGTYLDVATRLGICERRVSELVKSGKMIEPIRLGRSVKFDLVALDAWIDDGCPLRKHWSVRQKELRPEQAHANAGEEVQR